MAAGWLIRLRNEKVDIKCYYTAICNHAWNDWRLNDLFRHLLFAICNQFRECMLQTHSRSLFVLTFNTTLATYCSHKWSTISTTYVRMCQQWMLSFVVQVQTHTHIDRVWVELAPSGEEERKITSDVGRWPVCNLEEMWTVWQVHKYGKWKQRLPTCKCVDWIIHTHRCLIGTRA